MTEALTGVQIGALFICAVAQGWLVGFMFWNARRQRAIQKTLAEVEARQKFIQDVIDKSGAAHQWVGLHTWKDLDAQSREMFRLAITQVLAEMDSTPQARLH